MAYAIELQNITKRFPGVIANDQVTILVGEGEIHGLIGENGAGKSTIMNILYGLTQADEGIVRIFGKEQFIASPNDAIRLGIGMIHQHFMLMPNQTVLRNIILGSAPRKGPVIDEKKARIQIEKIMEKYCMQVNLDAVVSQISVGEKQKVEIIKALYREVRILILDEPTAVLTPAETDALIETMRKLKEQGCTIVFITHKLKEVLAATDRVTVMRKGVVTGFGETKDMNVRKLSELIVGREVNFDIPFGAYCPGETLLELSGVSTAPRGGRMPVKEINLKVKRGEIVGVAGVEGNGQSDLIEVIAGLIAADRGGITLCEKDISKLSIRQRRLNGLSHIPEDRLKTGTSTVCSISENLLLNKYFLTPFSRHGIFNHRHIKQHSKLLCDKFLVKTPDPSYELKTLSGGNMQKVVFAREFDTEPSLMIAAQPTRGVDIGAIEYIHGKLAELRDSGKGILLISAELDEIMALSDRILVMYEGEIVAEFHRGEADEYEIGAYMLGAKRQVAHSG
ncbi:MAG: heme transporter ATP-binding protein [Bacillota bacterium]|jgi:simple sugar transport system ATP-binding protein|nr:heme transporter ATP-binding protein [Bacillota bacterium]